MTNSARIACTLCVTLAIALGAHEARALDIDTRLNEAQRLAAHQEDAAAIDSYRALLADGVDGAALRYNLGTLLLERGDVGAALLQLRAARRLDPGDDDIAHNLAVALESRADRLAGDAATDPLLALGERTHPRTARLALAVPLVVLALLLAALGIAAGRARKPLVVAALVAFVASAAGAVVFAARASFEGTREAVVMVQSTARKDADANAAESFVAHPGLSGVVVDDVGAFVRLRLDNGLEAWLAKDAVSFVP